MMATIKIQNFAGMVPRLPARALGENAQLSNNLLATATEFRPLQDDLVVATPLIVNARTLYRLSRTAAGVLRNDDTTGFIARADEVTYVKGQLNDDTTERTYYTVDDGSFPPQVVQTSGAERTLGVQPPPSGPTILVTKTGEFTVEKAEAFITDTLVAGSASRLLADIQDRRYQTNGVITLTATSEFDTVVATPYVARKMGSDVADRVKIAAFPKFAAEVTTTLNAFLTTVTNPASTASPQPALFTAAEAADLRAKLVGFFGLRQIEPDLKALDAAVTAFRAVMQRLSTAVDPAAVAVVNKPGPEVPEYVTNEDFSVSRNPAFFDYDRFIAAKERQQIAAQELEATTNGLITEAQRHQKTASDLVIKIERIYAELRVSAPEFVATTIKALDLFRSDGAVNGRVLAADPTLESRFYVYTHVTDRGEESAPSPVSTLIEIDANDIVQLTLPPPLDVNVTHFRLYRSNVSSNGAEFQYVPFYPLTISGTTVTRGAENKVGIPKAASGGTVYRDTIKASELGEVVPSTTWAPPPVRSSGANPFLRGLVGMPNGIMAGFIDNFVAFCEPYKPYAWPVEYQITTDTPIVGLGVFGQSLFVGTRGNPYIISGADSSTMTAQRLDVAQACASRRSIVSLGGGIIYASPDGLMLVSSGGMDLITKSLFSREDWQALNPASIIAVGFENVYYFTYSGSGGGTYALDFEAKKLTRLNMTATAFFNDPTRDALFYVTGSQIRKAFSTGRRTGVWRSGVQIAPGHSGFAWVQVDGDQSAGAPATVRWFGDGELRHTATFTNTLPQRVRTGRFLEHEVEVESAARITKVMLASSTQELKSA